jgi:sterol desaturase/sphingolipid hydroxylase (fatty acid hydroxylase superfamily)
MQDYLVSNAATVYAGGFYGALIIVALWEALAPRRRLSGNLRVRWTGNGGVFLLNMFILRALIPLTGIALALVMKEKNWGLFNLVPLPVWLSAASSLLLLDLVHYLTHILLHRIPLLWRCHRMHHTDCDFDFSTGVRFHPFEAVLSTAVTLAIIAILGVPVVAVVLYEVITAMVTFLQHGNVRYPAALDRFMRRLIVTADMHRIHHSSRLTETESNYGVVLPWWDRLFGTYLAEPAAGHENMGVGLHEFQHPRHQAMPWMLAAPFLEKDGTTDAAKTGQVL